MKTIKLQIAVSIDGGVLTLKTDGTVWEDIDVSSLIVKVYTESKTTPIYSVTLNSEQISALQGTDGLQANTDYIIPTYFTVDDFYILCIDGTETNEELLNSEYVCVGSTYNIERQFRNETLDTAFSQMYSKNNVSPSNLMLSISHVNGHMLLEHLGKLSTYSDYTYDREIAWRKINQVLYSYYGS